MLVDSLPRNRQVTLAATFAAIYGTLKLIPISAWIGPSGRAFTATEFLAPLLGIILGPYAGSVAAMVGTFLGIILTGRMNFFGLDFLPVVMNPLVLGSLMRRRRLVSVVLYSGLLALFFVHPSTLHFISIPLPNGAVEFPFVWLHIVAWALLLSPLGKRSVEWILDHNVPRATIATCILTLIGTTAQHLTGTLLFATMAVPLMGMEPETLRLSWIAVFYVYPVERLIITLGATVVAVAVIKALGTARLFQATRKMATS